MAFELNSQEESNNLYLTHYFANQGDEFRTLIYTSSLAETLISAGKAPSVQVLMLLIEKGHFEAFFDLVEAYVQAAPVEDQPSLYAVLAQLSQYYAPDRYCTYEGHWQPTDLVVGKTAYDFIQAIFKYSTASCQSLLAESLVKIVVTEKDNLSMTHQLILLGDAIAYYAYAAKAEEAYRLLRSVLDHHISLDYLRQKKRL
ncbi:MAG: hypothetical protein HC921_15865 [Synechococcaceae cyanobacterium SM2_3_1]|nr:hypothetical protein [Synechococcaceae cyanobacterium SM2_3_1]